MERPRDEEIHIVTEAEKGEIRRLLARAEKRKVSPFKGIRDADCPTCEQPTLDYSDAMVYECYHAGGRVVVTNLSGTRCRNCGDQFFDLKSSAIIDRALEERVPGGYECTITTLGGERLGIYLPKDVVREMDIEPKQKAIIKLLSRRRMLIEV
ncbi:MAG: hypothetical protein ABH852_01575 [Methanobacteriota archaeon]